MIKTLVTLLNHYFTVSPVQGEFADELLSNQQSLKHSTEQYGSR